MQSASQVACRKGWKIKVQWGKFCPLEKILALGHAYQIPHGNGLGFRALKEGYEVVSTVAILGA